jgi:uncharacterized repeat protein (TIGR03803 family)
MQPKSSSTCLRAVAVTFAVVLFLTNAWAADHETVLYNFGASPYDGVEPTNLIMDAAGNLYGTTRVGGRSYNGTVFELSPIPGGRWTETVLYSFAGDPDGAEPLTITMDAAGNLYGTTEYGGRGVSDFCLMGHPPGCGTVFELSPRPGGGWTESVLYSFTGAADGSQAFGTLISDSAGNLYGTTADGGSFGEGTVFELSPGEGGDWTKTVLHSFGEGYDGSVPYAGVISDSAGNLYGTTTGGGQAGGICQIDGCGTVFELSPSAGGWTETVLHNFGGPPDDGVQPWGSLIMDAAGHLYGTTVFGGSHCRAMGCGTVFELSPGEGGGWSEAILHSFEGSPDDGSLPEGTLTLDAVGNLYGTTVYGASGGTVFKLSRIAGGGWRETLLHGFGEGNDGGDPSANVVMDRAGNLYGTTGYGGIYYAGIAFELTPPNVRPAASAAR